MKSVVKVKLLPEPAQAQALTDTLALCNAEATRIAAVARQRSIYRTYDLRAVTYADTRATGLGSQLAQQVVRKTIDAYATLKSNLTNGRYGRPGSKRRTRIEQAPITFRPDAAQAFDDRVLSWDHQAKTVSIWTVAGRIRIRFTGHNSQVAFLAQHRHGETDLVVDAAGQWFLVATCDTPDLTTDDPAGFVGVDLGIAVIAATATDTGQPLVDWSGGAVTARREKNQRLRTRLQRKGTKSAKRLLQRRSGKEARFVTDVNHQISKQIVTEAKRTGKGIAVEQLTGIRDRVRLRKPQRVRLHSWAFAQLGAFLGYKAAQAGVVFLQVDPAFTSQTCSGCGHITKQNRPDQATFCCVRCGVSLNADTNAAINIARKGVVDWRAANPQTLAA